MAETLNQIDVAELRKEVEGYSADPESCKIKRRLTAQWVGGTRSHIAGTGRELYIGGDQDFGAMSVTLASLLACEVDVIATRATLLGIEIESLAVDGVGDFNLGKYMGVADEPSPGFSAVELTVRIKARNATPDQLEALVKLCAESSPVGDSFGRAVPLNVRAEIVL